MYNKLRYYVYVINLIICLVLIYYLMLPVYIIVFWCTFIKCVAQWIYYSYYIKTPYSVEIIMYVPPVLTWKSYIWIIIQTPNFFANIRFYKIWSFKNDNKGNIWLVGFVSLLVFIIGLPINMFRVVDFWYNMYLILKFDFSNFNTHYVNLQNKYL